MQHKEIQKGNIHIMHNFEFSTIAERDTYIPTNEDINKVALILEPYNYYSLGSINPIKWENMRDDTIPLFNVARVGITKPQNLSTGQLTKVQFTTKTDDTDNLFDNVTNFRFQPKKAGYYQVNWAVETTGTQTYSYYQIS